MRVLKRAKRKITFAELFEPCALWMRKIRSGAFKSGELVVDGRYVDCSWANSFAETESACSSTGMGVGGRYRVNMLVVRAAHYLLKEIRGMSVDPPELSQARPNRWSRR